MKLESLEELRVFVQIVESGSMAAAARALGLPSSTVSRKLGLLEDRLGTQLLNRTTRTLHLSADGRVALARIRRVLDEAEETEAALERSASGLGGVVRIGVPSVLTRDLLNCLAPLLADNPGLRLQVSVHDRPVNPVAEGLDLVVSGGGLEDSTLVARSLGQVRLVLAASTDYLDRRGRPKTPNDLLQHDTSHFRTDPPASSWELYDRKGERHDVPIEVNWSRPMAAHSWMPCTPVCASAPCRSVCFEPTPNSSACSRGSRFGRSRSGRSFRSRVDAAHDSRPWFARCEQRLER